MHSLWRKLCGLALGVALLPSLAGGGACLEHAAHALRGADSTAVPDQDAHAGHNTSDASRVNHAHAEYAGVASEASDAHAEHASDFAPHVSDLHAAHKSSAIPGVGAPHDQPAFVASLNEAPGANCCAPSGSPEHCGGAAGCSVSAMVVAASAATHVVSASPVLPTGGALAPPGPSRAPDVPPPRA